MRLVDTLFRGGHLSERALIDAVMTGDRPAHLDRCDICASRAVDLGRWLDQMRTLAVETADEAFPAERLAAQQQQILRKLEALDQPARVISFPNQFRLNREGNSRRVAVGWVGVAAAAGLLMGVVSTQAAQRLTRQNAPIAAPTAATATTATTQQAAVVADPTPDVPAVTQTALAANPGIVEEMDRSLPAEMMAWAPRPVRANFLTVAPIAGGGR